MAARQGTYILYHPVRAGVNMTQLEVPVDCSKEGYQVGCVGGVALGWKYCNVKIERLISRFGLNPLIVTSRLGEQLSQPPIPTRPVYIGADGLLLLQNPKRKIPKLI